MRIRHILLFAALLAALSCHKDDKGGSGGTERHIVEGSAPVSGGILAATLDGGLAPLSFTKTISNHCVGCSYRAGAAMPDLFFQCPTGVKAGNGIQSCLGLNLCEFREFAGDGSPVYSAPVAVGAPWDMDFTKLRILRVGDRLLAFGAASSKIRVAEYDASARSFGNSWTSQISLTGLDRDIVAFDIIPGSGNTAELIILCYDITDSYKPDMDDVSESYYDSAGIYRGKMYYGRLYRADINLSSLTQQGTLSLISPESGVALAPGGVAGFKTGMDDGWLCVNKFGVLKFVPRRAPLTSEYVVGFHGEALSNPFVSGAVLAIRPAGESNCNGIIVSGEGSPRWFKYDGTTGKAPVFEDPKPLLMKSGDLYAGSLPVPTLADWDDDGALDIVTGNSEGRLLYFKNYGTDAAPAFGQAEYLKSAGEEICFRAGYYEVQGPFEAAWGYLCPVVFDWNGDGLKDIVFSGNEGKFEVMLNEGRKGAPSLGRRQGIYADGLELYGMWRVRPALAKLGDRILVAIMDGDDALHLYEKAAGNNVKDLGKLCLSDGKFIYGHRETAANTLGERGREKLEFADWDGDGLLDLIIGTPLQASVPDPARGLPWSRTTRGLQTMWLKNVGSNENMIFAYPRQFLFRGQDFHIGTHANGPTVCMLGNINGGLPNLLVSGECGKFFFFDRGDLTELSLW